MMTTAVNTLAFRNLSLVCRNGTEAVARITQSPFITSPSSSSIPAQRRPFGVRRTVTARRPQQESTTTKSTATRKRSRKGSVVRFAPETIQESEHQQQFERPRAKRRRFEASDSTQWYSRGELKDIQKSCISSLRARKDDGSLERFQPQNQQKRKMARKQAYETIKAVQAFEKATGTKAPPELLSMLLQRSSMSRAIEANTTALRMANACSRN